MKTIKNQSHFDHQGNEVDLTTIMNAFIEHKRLILISGILFLSAGMVFSQQQPLQYKISALIKIEENRSSSTGMLGNMSSALNLGGRGNETAIQTALIQSRFVLEPVIQSLGLDIRIKKNKGIFERLTPETKQDVLIKTFTVPSEQINKPFFLKYNKEKQIILYDEHKKPILKGDIGTLLTNKEKTIQLEIESVKTKPNTSFTLKKLSATQLVDSLSNRLHIEDLAKKGSTGVLSVSLQDTNPELASQIINTIVKEAKHKNLERKSLEASQTLDFLYTQVPILKKSLEKSELALNEYRAKSGKIDMKLQTQIILNRLSELDKELSGLHLTKIDMSQRYTHQHPAFQALQNQIKEIEKIRDEVEKTLNFLPLSDQIVVNLMRDTEVKNNLYIALLNKIQELQVVKAGLSSDVSILSYANLPATALPKKQNLIYIGSVLLSLLFSSIVIFAKKLLFPRIQDPLWIENHYGIANLAIIPYSQEQHQNTNHAVTPNKKQIPLLAHVFPRNLSIESLRSLRTSLQVHLSCSKNNIISILGVMPGVGKTFVSTNLAYLLATADKRVLLIDADLRRGTSHRYFNIPASPGLTELIQGNTTPTEAIKTVMHENLSVLPRGTHPDDPSELLSNKNFKPLINELAQHYDIIIIDTAPILLVTDAALIGSLSSINYLVLGSGIHQPSEIEMAMKRLNAANVNVNGSIFNFHNASSDRNPYYRKYYSYKQYYVN